MAFVRPTPRRRSRYILPALAFLGLLLWMKATEKFILGGGSGSSSNNINNNFQRTEHRSNKEWAANFAGGSKTVALLPDGDGEEAAAARKHLQALLHRRRKAKRLKSATKLFLKRRDAFAMLLRSDNEVRRQWNARLSTISAPRGIMVTAGGETPLANAFSVLYVLRNTIKCTLPVTIAHWGPDELDSKSVNAFKKYLPDISFLNLLKESVDFSSLSSDSGSHSSHHHVSIETALELATDPKSLGYIAKVAAMYAAPYREILLLDSDSLPLQDPSLLFETEAYKRHGSMFWPDFLHKRPEIWDVLGFYKAQKLDPWTKPRKEMEEEDEGIEKMLLPFRQTESGQILIDRVRHWKVLEWLLFLNTHAQVVYQLNPSSIGDKDLYALAFILAGNDEDFWQVPFPPGLPAIENNFDSRRTDEIIQSNNSVENESQSSTTYESTTATTPRSKSSAAEPDFFFGGMLQFHPENGSPFFHHRTANSKLPGRGHIDPAHGLITHVSPSASVLQSQKMTAYRGWIPNWLFRFYRNGWGLWSSEVQIVECIGSGEGKEGGGGELERLSGDSKGEEGERRGAVIMCSECNFNLMDLNKVDEVCYSSDDKVRGGFVSRNMVEKERDPLPISMVKVGRESVVGVAMVAAIEAHILFQAAVE